MQSHRCKSEFKIDQNYYYEVGFVIDFIEHQILLILYGVPAP